MATAKHSTADLLAARREGLSYAAIGRRFGITKQSAWERIERAEKNAPTAPPPATAEVIDIPAFLKPRGDTGLEVDTSATPEKRVEIVRRIVDGLPEELQKALAGDNQGHKITVWKATYGYGWWVGINDRRFNASQRYIESVGFEEAFRTILTRETILPDETIAHDNRSFERDTGVVAHTLPPGYAANLGNSNIATAGDVIAIIERPITEADDDFLPEPLPESQPLKGWSARIAASIARLFGGRS